MEHSFLNNVKLDEKQVQTILELSTEQEPILFAVVGEITEKAKYGTTVLLGTRAH